jgi:dCMP deaminase
MDKRPSVDEYYISIADTVSTRSTCLRRHYGAVIVKDDMIISTGYNGSPRKEENCCDCGVCERESLGVPKGERYELCVAIHAEDNAVTAAGRERTQGATMYISGRNVADGSLASPAPCKMCRRKLINAGITRVVGMVDGKVTDIDITSYR